jgi:hypothetical protein
MKPKQRPVEIVGVVHPLGAAGSKAGRERFWTLGFSFIVWRGPDGRAREQPLRVEKPNLSGKESRALMDSIQPYDVLRVRLRLPGKPAKGRLRGELVKLLGKERADKDFKARAAQLKKPVRVKHPALGTFTLDRALDWYEARPNWDGRRVHLYLSREDCADEDALFALAEGLWKERKKWDRRARDFAAEELLDLKNGDWLDDGEKELTARRFKARMTLESVLVNPDGRFEFTYDDGNLFWGHVIQVSGTLAQGPTRAGIAG